MTTLAAPCADDSTRFSRLIEKRSALPAGIMSPSAGVRPVKLCSLREVGAFLVPFVDEQNDRQMKINYVNTGALVAWVGDVVGDVELASQIGGVVAGGQPYGLQVPEIKRLVAERVAQYSESLQGVE